MNDYHGGHAAVCGDHVKICTAATSHGGAPRGGETRLVIHHRGYSRTGVCDYTLTGQGTGATGHRMHVA